MTDDGLKAKLIGDDNQKYTILFVKGNNGKMDLLSSIFVKLWHGWDNLVNPKTYLRDAYSKKILEFMKANQ
ncbi:MAG: hypothetical protein IJQ82_11415 [Selenomonadaceae bacterium]|nr:hypothetical protein [Selenomonadaceae bacterium]